MIKLKSKGEYEISLDGVNFKRLNNLLVNGYYQTTSGSISCQVGTNSTPAAPTDTAITNPINSTSVSAPTESYTYDNVREVIIVKRQYQINFPANLVATINEIGIRQGVLVSRAVFAESILLEATDTFIVRFTLTTEIDAKSVPLSVELDGLTHTATMLICNPNRWAGSVFGVIAGGACFYVVTNNNTYVKGADGYATGGGNLIKSGSAIVSTVGGTAKVTTYAVASTLDDTNVTFDAIALMNQEEVTAGGALVIIKFDAPVVKSKDYVFDLHITITQER